MIKRITRVLLQISEYTFTHLGCAILGWVCVLKKCFLFFFWDQSAYYTYCVLTEIRRSCGVWCWEWVTLRMSGVEVGNSENEWSWGGNWWVGIVCVKYVIEKWVGLMWVVVRMSGVEVGNWWVKVVCVKYVREMSGFEVGDNENEWGWNG